MLNQCKCHNWDRSKTPRRCLDHKGNGIYHHPWWDGLGNNWKEDEEKEEMWRVQELLEIREKSAREQNKKDMNLLCCVVVVILLMNLLYFGLIQ